MRLCVWFLVLSVPIYVAGCEKEPNKFIPASLTEKLWTLDTILINPPLTYDALTEEQKFNYNAALAWSAGKAQITFHKDGSVTCSGDWDYGYSEWDLINSNKDIQMKQGAGYDTLRSWQASDFQFSYTHDIGTTEALDCTLLYKRN